MSLVDHLENKINIKSTSHNLPEHSGKEIKEVIRKTVLFIVASKSRRHQ